MSSIPRVVLVAMAGVAWRAQASAEPLAMSTYPVGLHPEVSSVRAVGALKFRGGLDLRSRDIRFGGLSALAISRSGDRLLSLTDKGNWVEISPTYGPSGNLFGIGEAWIGALDNLGSGSINGSRLGDVEAIAPTDDGYAVSFEGRHRLWLYRRDRVTRLIQPRPLRSPRGLHRAPSNGGIEALATLADGRLFALTEELEADTNHMLGWVTQGRNWQALRYRRTGRFVPTGATTLANGDLLVLERRFTWLGGFASRIVRLRHEDIRANATLDGSEVATIDLPLTVENFEGIAVRSLPEGGAHIYLISDDNFHVLQRTLLLMFEYRG